MKKILFCAGLVALATSCTQDETISLDVQKQNAKGITFEIVEKVDSRVQYNQEEGAWNPFWYAEQDRIAIWANGVGYGALTPATGDTIDGTYWKDFTNQYGGIYQYKATSSTNKANWTAVDDANTMTFVKNDKKGAKFLAVYPYNASLTLSGESPVVGKNDTLKISGALTTLNAQTIKTAKGWNDEIVMVAGAARTQDEVFESVGEKMALAFSHATPVMKFGTKGLTADYQKAFGNLKEITVKTLGYDKNADGDWADAGDIKPSPLYYTNGAIQVTDSVNWKAEYVPTTAVASTDSTNNNTIVVTIGDANGLAWSDAALAPIAVAPTKRSNYGTNGERITADFEFENITIQVEKKNVTKDCVVGKNFQAITLNMADYPYLVTNTAPRTLFVNSGDFSAVKHVTGTTVDGILWNGAKVKFSEFGKVVVAKEVVLDAEDFKILNKLTAVTDVILNGNTSVPAKAMRDMVNLNTIEMPLVTTIAVDAFKSGMPVDTIVMPAYKFNEAVNDSLLNPAYLKYIELGATALNAGFPKTGLKFDNYTLLEEVKVNDNIELGPNAFENCTALKKITGVLKITGTDVFKNCPVLNNVVVNSTVIPAGVFDGCTALSKIYLNSTSTALVPTKIGNRAFAGTAAALDLSATTEIGDGAFENVTALQGAKYSDANPVIVLKVGAATIGNGAFDGCTGLKLVEFTNATSIKDSILIRATSLEQVKFVKKFTYGGTTNVKPSVNSFGSQAYAANIDLFVAEGQTGIGADNKTFTITAGNKSTEITFKSITEE